MTGVVQQDTSSNAGTKVTVGPVGPDIGADESAELPNLSELEERDNQGISEFLQMSLMSVLDKGSVILSQD